jgi:hypothetical protein
VKRGRSCAPEVPTERAPGPSQSKEASARRQLLSRTSSMSFSQDHKMYMSLARFGGENLVLSRCDSWIGEHMLWKWSARLLSVVQPEESSSHGNGPESRGSNRSMYHAARIVRASLMR